MKFWKAVIDKHKSSRKADVDDKLRYWSSSFKWKEIFAISVTRVAAVDLRWNPWWVHDVAQINLTVSSLPTHVTLLVHRVYMISSASKMKATMTWYHIKSLLKSAATNKHYRFFKSIFLAFWKIFLGRMAMIKHDMKQWLLPTMNLKQLAT